MMQQVGRYRLIPSIEPISHLSSLGFAPDTVYDWQPRHFDGGAKAAYFAFDHF